jgi:predicted GIY-YIG superfamily endonuclease
MSFWLYILQCADQSLYIGHTDNLDERMRLHDPGVFGSYSVLQRPLILIRAQEFDTRYEALTM